MQLSAVAKGFTCTPLSPFGIASITIMTTMGVTGRVLNLSFGTNGRMLLTLTQALVRVAPDAAPELGAGLFSPVGTPTPFRRDSMTSTVGKKHQKNGRNVSGLDWAHENCGKFIHFA